MFSSPRKKKRATPAKRPAAQSSHAASYDRHKTRTADTQSRKSRAGRDIGAIRPIVDPKRRDLCRDDPERFLRTYLPESFPLPFCKDHLDGIDRIRESFTLGALYALAWDRGKGKTSICRGMALWGVSYAKLRYLFLLNATAAKAQDSLAALKTFIRFLQTFRDDFPEICQAAEHLAGIAQKATGQLCDGEPTQIEWSQDRLILPTVPPPENWDKARWPLRSDGMVPTSGVVIGSAGMTAEGIRGSLVTLRTGENIRPDAVLIDDPLSSEAAHSLTQNQTVLGLISADVLGMAGPGRSIAGVMPCTVQCPGDAIDQILDRKKNPVWRGDRRGILRSMPKNLEAWEKYFEIYFDCAQKEPPDYDAANAYYCAHRAALDEGAEASWDQRKLPHEISAVQHAMHLYARDRFAFWSEYMNRPLVRDETGEQLKVDSILARLNNLEREAVPLNANLITVGADCGKSLLWYVVVAWEMSTFTGSIISYGSTPRQDRQYYSKADAKQTLALAFPGLDAEAAIQAGLTAMAGQLLGREWKSESGTPLKVTQMLVDSKYVPDTICEWARRSPHSAIIFPSQGRYVGAKSTKQWHQYEKRQGERLGLHWLIAPVASSNRATRIAAVDVNYWKTQVAQKLTMPAANKGAISLWGRPGEDHVLFAHHCTAQFGTDVSAHGRTVREWQDRPDRRDQCDLWDCLVYATAAASIQGAVMPSVAGPAKPQPRMSLADWQAKKVGK